MKFKVSKLGFRQLTFNQKAIVILLILAIFYTGAYIYSQYRLTVEYNADIQKWCMVHIKDFKGDNSMESLKRCEKYF